MSKEFEHECAITRRVLERIPEASYNWKPHEKSWPAAGLAAHIANLAGWVVPTLDQAGLDLDPSAHGTWLPAGRAELGGLVLRLRRLRRRRPRSGRTASGQHQQCRRRGQAYRPFSRC